MKPNDNKLYRAIIVRCKTCAGTVGGEVLVEEKYSKTGYALVGRMVVEAVERGDRLSIEACSYRHPISFPTCQCERPTTKPRAEAADA